MSRALRTLAEAGFVERDPETLRYRVGWRLVALGLRGRDDRLVGAAPPALASLVATTGETAYLVGARRVGGADARERVAAARSVVAASWVGRTVPAWCTAAGRTLLADDDPAELESRVGRTFGPAGPNAPRDVGELARRIAADRARGYAVAEEELEAGLVAVAAPVRDASGRIVAAIIVSGPAFRLSPKLAEAGTAVRRAADAVSRAIASRHAA